MPIQYVFNTKAIKATSGREPGSPHYAPGHCKRTVKHAFHGSFDKLTASPLFGPSGESRTHGLLNPIQARYQTALHPVIRGLAVISRYYYTRRSQKVKGESSKKFNFFEDSVFCVLPLCVLDRPEVPDAAGNRKGKSGRLGDPERIPYPRNAPQPAKSPGQGQQQNQLTQQ